MKITMDLIAKQAGVSKTTVSRIVNGNYAQVNEATKQRVMNIIQELNYRPNALAQSLKQMKTNVIAIVLSNLQNPFWSQVLPGVEDTCRIYGYNLMICNSNDETELEKEHIEVLRMKQVDGIIINPTMKNNQLFQEMLKKEFPVVAINRKIEGVPVNTVSVDNVKGASLAVNHLVENGCKSIAIMVYPSQGVSPRMERIEGYKKAMLHNGIALIDSHIKIIEEKKGNAKKEVKKLLSQDDRPEAVFSTNNIMTLEILEGIKELGLRVPEDVKLVGYDETVWSEHIDPPLTTVSQPSYQMGKLAAEKLISILQSGKKEAPELKLLDPELIIRKSSGS